MRQWHLMGIVALCTILMAACATAELNDDMNRSDSQNSSSAATPSKTDQDTGNPYSPNQYGASPEQNVPPMNHHGHSEQTGPNPSTTGQPNASDGTAMPGLGSTCEPEKSPVYHAQHTPRMRVTMLKIPVTMADSRAYGCDVLDSGTGGVGLARLLDFLKFNLDDLIKPDVTGKIPALINVHLSQWPQQPSSMQGSAPMMSITSIPQSENATPNQPNAAPVLNVPASASCESLSTGRGELRFSVPLLDDMNVVPLTLKNTHVEGDLAFDSNGVFINRGTINGYLHRDDVKAVLDGLNDACTGSPKPEVCNGADTLIAGNLDELMDGYILPFLGGLDTRIGGRLDDPAECEMPDCNALSVCIAFETISDAPTSEAR